MKFISAGHCTKPGKNYDPGATGVNGRTEAAEAVKMRDEVVKQLKNMGYNDIVTDLDAESLKEYLARIQTGSGSVVVEFHFNAFNGKATGIEVLVQKDADKMDISFAKEMAKVTAAATKLPLRSGGVKSEADSKRGSLGLMRENGIVALVELCFIDNPADMAAYDKAFSGLASAYAAAIAHYDTLIN